MHDKTVSAALKINKHKRLYYVLAHTRGIVGTLVGYLITLALLCCGKKPHKYHNSYYIKIGANWGGFQMGIMFIRDTTSRSELNKHEYGHSFQNCIFGVFYIPLVTIPSTIRYWHRRIHKTATPYDDIWFEGSATKIGNETTKEKNTNGKEK